MSIFKDTFKPKIQEQLKARQDAIFERTPDAIQYFNARNAWIRMSSSVNVNGSNTLAKNNILQGILILQGFKMERHLGVPLDIQGQHYR